MTERANPLRGACRVCGDEFNLTSNGRIRSHGPRDARCEGGSDLPARVEPWTPTRDETEAVTAGPNPHRDPLPTTQPVEVQPVGVPEYTGTASGHRGQETPFSTAVPVSQTPTIRGGDGLRPGPEPSDFDRWGRYRMPDPATGAVAGRQRVTTFVKMISDQWGLSQWQQRVLLVGAADNPTVAATAAGKNPKADKTFLDQIATALKDAAGAKDAAAFGTRMHTHTERADMGLMTEEEWTGLPDPIRRDLSAYTEEISSAGLVPLPEMVERTTMVRSLDVTGTLDRIFRLPNGDHVIGDVKTGADLSYGWLDIGMQLACYAHGVNENGVFDWGTREWLPAPKVREDFAIVMHLPAGKGTCTLYRVDIRQGWANCALARSVRDARKVRNHAEVLDLETIQGAPKIPAVGHVVPDDCMGAGVCDLCGSLMHDEPAPLTVQPHSEAFAPSVVADPAEDTRRAKARGIMRSVASQEAARELYGFALEVWPHDEAFLLELAGIGREALRAAGYQLL